MEKLIIKETKHSPLVTLDHTTGAFEIKGSSFLDNAHEFYTPLILWIREYTKKPHGTTKVLFELNYINTSSQRMLFDFLKELNALHKAGNSVHIDWLYDESDYDLRDVGEDLLSFMDFSYKIIEKVS
ncbi:MAG: DUF1987 domain-containing protein [Bacteroidia bacterium]|jgi:SiaC family regulatory phosphoprotein|nr:DUF1987 domain-containing protein [Bacteroidia bacterium]